MTNAERGIAAGYGGIWHNIEPLPVKKHIWKYERVFDYDIEDKVFKDVFIVPSEEAKKKYFIHGDKLYKLVNPDGELFDWLKDKDPLA